MTEKPNYEKLLLQINEAANHALQYLKIPEAPVVTYLLQIASLSDLNQTRLHDDWAISNSGCY